jgi:thioredoxin reductase (NADPH)
VPAPATALEQTDGHYIVRLDGGEAIAARAVVIATGARYRKLPIARLDEFEGTSVFYAATEGEAQRCQGDPVAVVGGGNSAGQAALFLARRASRVVLLRRGETLTKDMSRYLADRIERDERIDVRCNTEVRELVGGEQLEAVIVEDSKTGERRQIDARALFAFIGADPYARWLAGEVALDERGFVVTGPDAIGGADRRARWNVDRDPLPLETSLPGVFAVGDVRSGSIKRVAAAVGEGSMAVRLVHDYLERATDDGAHQIVGAP